MQLDVTVPGYDFEPGDGHPLVLKASVINSVDRTTSVSIQLNWLRLVCGNALMYGIGAAGFRKPHFSGINAELIAGYLDDSLQLVPQQQGLLQQWMGEPVRPERLNSWVNGPVNELWGSATACRAWHIIEQGQDGDVQAMGGKPAEERAMLKSVPTSREFLPIIDVPGAEAPVTTKYHAAQALSWLAKHKTAHTTMLYRLRQIPPLMEALETGVLPKLNGNYDQSSRGVERVD
jgi:hypothetical protein